MTSKADKPAAGKLKRAEDKPAKNRPPTQTSGNTLRLSKMPGQTDEAALAAVVYDPLTRALTTGQTFLRPAFGDRGTKECLAALCARAETVRKGDLRGVERTLVAQADTLDAIFTELARRAALNVGQYIGAAETYLRLALKAQSQCRATLETLANIKNPPVVIAKQANIAAGPQQINNGAAVPARAHAGKKDEIDNQPHALDDTATAGCADARSAPLLRHEQALPMPLQGACDQRQKHVPHARRGKG